MLCGLATESLSTSEGECWQKCVGFFLIHGESLSSKELPAEGHGPWRVVLQASILIPLGKLLKIKILGPERWLNGYEQSPWIQFPAFTW